MRDRIGIPILVTDNSSVWVARNWAGLESDLPVRYVSAEEGQVDAVVARCFHGVSHLPGPVFIVSRGKKCLVQGRQFSAFGGAYSGLIGNVEASFSKEA